jgi:tripartite-type tricarboxylate transporter receptor subunit TctC
VRRGSFASRPFRFAKLGGEPMAMAPAEFDAFVQSEIAMNAALVKAAGIKPNP